jgi:amino acid adenylation domain-containing protein
MHRSSSNDPACRSEIGPRRASFHRQVALAPARTQAHTPRLYVCTDDPQYRSSSASAHSSICADDDSAVKCILRGEVRPDFARFATLAELFEHTVSQVGPSHVALQFGHEAMTYAELNAKADIAAHNLLLRGAGPNRVVGLFLNRGMGALVAQGTSPRVHKLTRFCCRAVAIAKAGAAWLPLDEEVPMDRACACLGDAGAIVCITEREVVCDGMACVSLAMLFAPCPPPLLRRDATRVAGEDTAYLIYTSGSTGKPKGIEICQHSIAHFLLSENSIIGIRKDDVVYQGFSLAFDMSFEEIWLSYASGAKIWIAPKEIITDVEALTAALERARVTVLHAVPTLLALFPKDLPTLRLINLGGEACPQALVEKWAVKPRRVFNTYGPSEATVSASIAELFQGQPVTIGRPLPNYGLCVCKVVDGPVASLLPAGQAGELCIFGPGLARGYLGRPDLSAKKFIECEDLGGERVYKTGDLALVDGQGQLSCLGR